MNITACRMCKSARLQLFLDLGIMPPADQFVRKEQLDEPQVYYPLKVLLCEDCALVQLSHVVSPEILYQKDYPYEASVTQAGRDHWSEFADTVDKMLGRSADDLVVDVGSNVGVLLEMFNARGFRTLGVDPAPNIVQIAIGRGTETVCDFFGRAVARRIAKRHGQARVITATNVFAHVNDLDNFMDGVDILLRNDGAFILEAPYLVNLLRNLEYDTIYHEHLSYLSVRPLVKFFERFGMHIFEIQERDIHGGSFRVFVRRKGADVPTVTPVVEELLALEEQEGVHDLGRLETFAADVEKNRQDMTWLLRRLKHESKSIVGVSAPAKGMTLLNYCHIGRETLDFITEKSRLKIGKYTPGMQIPVLSDDELLEDKPNYALLLAWNFAEEIISNLSDFRRAGGKFIIPIPKPRIVE